MLRCMSCSRSPGAQDPALAEAWHRDETCIDLWWAALDVPGADDRTLLSPRERARAEKQDAAGTRGVFGASRSLLRRVLARYVECSAASLALVEEEHGRPVLEPCGSLDFNLSHSGRYAVVAVGHGVRIGVDLECSDREREFAALARRFFSKEEATRIHACEGAGQRRAFYDLWVCKEAYLKALGTGLTFSARRFTVSEGPDGRPSIAYTEFPGDDPAHWAMDRISIPLPTPTPGADVALAAAVCWRGGPRRLRSHRLASLTGKRA
jgi:4'-phosphopantetheinyl transferase